MDMELLYYVMKTVPAALLLQVLLLRVAQVDVHLLAKTQVLHLLVTVLTIILNVHKVILHVHLAMQHVTVE